MIGKSLRVVKQIGPDNWMAVCPAHEDRRASLALKMVDGKLLMYCHAKCDTRDVLAALGMRSVAELAVMFGGPVKIEPLPFECSRKRRGGGKRGELVQTYDYTDETGKLLYQVCRMEPKAFLQRRPDGSGGWIWNLQGVRRVLYRLPELHRLPRESVVWIVEGEKDADRLVSRGLHATTNAGGAGKWRREYCDVLRGHRVAVIADNDDAGREHAHEIEKALRRIAKHTVTLELPGLPPKGDVSDWLNAGGVAGELFALARQAYEARQSPTKKDAAQGQGRAAKDTYQAKAKETR